jgi:hypothetical protein
MALVTLSGGVMHCMRMEGPPAAWNGATAACGLTTHQEQLSLRSMNFVAVGEMLKYAYWV